MDLEKAKVIKEAMQDIDELNCIIEKLEKTKEINGNVIIQFSNQAFQEKLPKESISRMISFIEEERERRKSLIETM